MHTDHWVVKHIRNKVLKSTCITKMLDVVFRGDGVLAGLNQTCFTFHIGNDVNALLPKKQHGHYIQCHSLHLSF